MHKVSHAWASVALMSEQVFAKLHLLSFNNGTVPLMWKKLQN